MTFRLAESLRAREFGNSALRRQRLSDFVTKSKMRAAAIVEFTRCEPIRCGDVPDQGALEDAERDISVDDFRRPNSQCWTNCGKEKMDEDQIVMTCVYLIEVR